MVYLNQFVAVLKYGGQVLREQGKGEFLLPLGSEYSVYLKNMSGRRAVVTVEIDGKDVLNGQCVLVNANSSCELEGFLDKNGNVTHRFKFIEKTQEISDHRGDRAEDGLIRIGYRYEETPVQYPVVKTTEHHHHHHYPATKPWWDTPYSGPASHPGKTYRGGDINYGATDIPVHDKSALNRDSSAVNDSTQSNDGINSLSQRKGGAETFSMGLTGDAGCQLQGFGVAPEAGVAHEADEGESKTSGSVLRSMNVKRSTSVDGITVKGSASQQKFKYSSVGRVEKEEHVIVLQLKGDTEQKPVRAPIFVHTRLECETCGKISKSSAKFCDHCGTSLLL